MQKALKTEQERYERVSNSGLTDQELAAVQAFTQPEAILMRLEDLAKRAREKEDFSAELKALELAGKSQAMWTDRKVVDDASRWTELLNQATALAEGRREKLVN